MMENKNNTEMFEKAEKLAMELSEKATDLESLLEKCSECSIDNVVIYKMIKNMKKSAQDISASLTDISLDIEYLKRCLTGRIQSDPYKIPECNFFGCKTEEERNVVKEKYKMILKDNGFDVETHEVY